jgi:hypothetical protein
MVDPETLGADQEPPPTHHESAKREERDSRYREGSRQDRAGIRSVAQMMKRGAVNAAMSPPPDQQQPRDRRGGDFVQSRSARSPRQEDPEQDRHEPDGDLDEGKLPNSCC